MIHPIVSKKFDRANLAHFRFLGLRRGESDPHAIRSAATAMSGCVGACEGHMGVEGEILRRSEIAVAAYRLLDPRRRASFFERVQLGYPVDRDDRRPADAEVFHAGRETVNPWVSAAGIVSTNDSAATASATGKLMGLDVIERAIQEEMSEPTTAQAAMETLSWLEERREVIRSIRELESASEQKPSTVHWLRSVLGW
jgi:hypothetical protein